MDYPFHYCESLINITSGIEANTVVENDLLKAFEMGKAAGEKFFQEQPLTKSFYSPIKKLKLQTFSDMIVKQSVNAN